MTDSQLLIVQQAHDIAALKRRVDELEAAIEAVSTILFGIGGPLNDDRLGYTKEQRGPFFSIANALGI